MNQILLLSLFVIFAIAASAQDTAGWQRRAIAKYPDLAKEGTPIHTKYLALVAELKDKQPTFFNAPSWPVTLADRAAADLKAETAAKKAKAEEAAKQAARDALWNNKRTIREVETDQRSFIEKPFVLKGTIEVASYYNYGYRKSQDTHFAFEFNDGKTRANLYMERDKAAGLRKQLLDADGSLKGSFLVVIEQKRFMDSSQLYLEILDYKPQTE